MQTLLPVNHLTDYFIRIWIQCEPCLPEFEKRYSLKEQKAKEQCFEAFIEKVDTRTHRGQLERERKEKLTPQARYLFQSVFDFNEEQLEVIFSGAYKQITKDFVRMSRQFDPAVHPDDIFQACRNAWIMNGIQFIMGYKMELTPSVFAYSMLYPYSDNYLDNQAISRHVKMEFTKRFRARLCGQNVSPENEHEATIFKLVEMIEGQFNREKYPKVYASLLAIHDAQTHSLHLLEPESHLKEDKILSISFEKGGTSVLADGYLVAGDLPPNLERFCFGFGVALQLLDDMQDVKEDQETGQHTLFSSEPENKTRDLLAAKTLHFGERVFNHLDSFEGYKIPVYKSLIKKSVESMLLETILLNGSFFSPGFMKKTESYSPLRIAYLKKRRSRLSPQRISYMKKIMESVMSDLASK